MTSIKFTTQTLAVSDIDSNLGQIPDVPRNPRKIDDDDMAALKKSIADDPDLLGLWKLTVYPLDGRYVALSGNQRLQACRELKIRHLTCDVLDAETPPELLRKIVIKANRMAGKDDLDLLKIEWDFEELTSMWEFPDLEVSHDSQLLAEVESDDTIDEVPEYVETRCKLGDIWQLGPHRLMCGDSTLAADVTELMDGEKADMFLTDPPYNVNYRSSLGLRIVNDQQGDAQFLDFLTKAFQNGVNALKTGGAIYIWHAETEGYNFRRAIINVGLRTHQCLIWNKNSLILGRVDYQWKHEPCLYTWKEGAGHYFVDDRSQSTVFEDAGLNVHRMKKSELEELVMKMLGDRISTTVINENKPRKNDQHPTMKPVRLLARLIRNSSKAEETVLDLFGGSGSTLIACQQLNRRCLMMEIDPHYCDVILTRWERLTGETATKLEKEDEDGII